MTVCARKNKIVLKRQIRAKEKNSNRKRISEAQKNYIPVLAAHVQVLEFVVEGVAVDDFVADPAGGDLDEFVCFALAHDQIRVDDLGAVDVVLGDWGAACLLR